MKPFPRLQLMIRRTDRRDAMTLAFQVSGISGAEHIAAVKGEQVDAVAMPQKSANLEPGEIGCWRSHVNAWKRIVDARWETALIIEGTSSSQCE